MFEPQSALPFCSHESQHPCWRVESYETCLIMAAMTCFDSYISCSL